MKYVEWKSGMVLEFLPPAGSPIYQIFKAIEYAERYAVSEVCFRLEKEVKPKERTLTLAMLFDLEVGGFPK